MKKEEIEKAFEFLKKHEHFCFVQEGLEDGYRLFVFETHGLHAIKFPEGIEGDMRWYFYDRGTHMFSEEGVSLEKTDEWFQELVKRTKLSYECAIKNVTSRKTPMMKFEKFKKHDLFFKIEEHGDNIAYLFRDEKGSIHFFRIPKSLDGQFDWYFYVKEIYRAIEKIRGGSLSKTLPWFQDLAEEAETIFESLK